MWVPTDDFAQLQLQFADETQWRYEVIRPMVLFADRTPRVPEAVECPPIYSTDLDDFKALAHFPQKESRCTSQGTQLPPGPQRPAKKIPFHRT